MGCKESKYTEICETCQQRPVVKDLFVEPQCCLACFLTATVKVQVAKLWDSLERPSITQPISIPKPQSKEGKHSKNKEYIKKEKQ